MRSPEEASWGWMTRQVAGLNEAAVRRPDEDRRAFWRGRDRKPRSLTRKAGSGVHTRAMLGGFRGGRIQAAFRNRRCEFAMGTLVSAAHVAREP
jgi:hypothetical protein